MRSGIFFSTSAHVVILGAALFSLGEPKPLVAPPVEAISVDIVEVTSLSANVAGADDADLKEAPAPEPTKAPPTPEPAENVGEAVRDEPAPEPPKPAPVNEAAVPNFRPPAPQTPVPTPEVATEPEPEQEVAVLTEQPKPPEPQAEPEPTIEETAKPTRIVAPSPRPAAPRPKPETAKTPERKETKKVAKAAPEQPKAKPAAKDDTIKALLDKSETSGGGAKRSEKPKGAGTKTGNAPKLTRSELDALRGKIEGCWLVPGGIVDAEGMTARATFSLNRDGSLVKRAKVTVQGGSSKTAQRAFGGSVKRAIAKCAPFSELPADKYETWADVVVNFSLADML